MRSKPGPPQPRRPGCPYNSPDTPARPAGVRPTTAAEFAAKWRAADLSERSAYQQHFLDLCALLGEPTPAAVDPTGKWFTFEKAVATTDDRKGFADVWRRSCFAWKYKGKHKNLSTAYQQLLRYREALANPPLLIVCDLDKFQIHTNFTGTAKAVHEFDLDGLADPANVGKLRSAFTEPERLHPARTQRQVTEDVADRFARLADGLTGRGVPADPAARFLMKLMFCMFAEDIELLPLNLFTDTVAASRSHPAKLSGMLADLFGKMATGGHFGTREVLHFNGGLFADPAVLDLTPTEIDALHAAALCDWSQVEPSIFGTLFERTLNPAKRSQLGAHYTSREDIETLLKPLVLAPLQQEWASVRAVAAKLHEKAKGTKTGSKARKAFDDVISEFLDRLAHVKILDPACGSGNFLYVAINMLLTLEKEVLLYAAARGLSRFPFVRPTQLRGIEVNPYAQQLAQVVVWIGYLQWMRFNGFAAPNDPVLDTMASIENRDAVLDLDDPAFPGEPMWPAAEFVVGNPPFLGDKKMRGELGDAYVDALRAVYKGRVPGGADLVCYWFEKARRAVERGTATRVGLIATQGIRGGANRACLDKIQQSGGIFFGVSDRDWVLDGATVHVSMVGFDDGTETTRELDGKPVATIHADLKPGGGADVTRAAELPANEGKCFLGVMKSGPFDISEAVALEWLHDPNPHGRPNSDVLRPRVTARDLLQRSPIGWIIDFDNATDQAALCLYDLPWRHVENTVKPERLANRRPRMAEYWWLHGEARPGLRRGLQGLSRFIITPEVSKHRVFAWLDDVYLADHQTRAFTSADDGFFGVLQSRVHELWARAKGTQLREVESGFRYTPTTCFETFPFPAPTPGQSATVAAAAAELDAVRSAWLNPPEWTTTEVLTFPGSAAGPWRRYITDANAAGVGTVRYPRVVAKDATSGAKLKARTLTALYNARPTWLTAAHARLDATVADAYGWPADLPADLVLAKLLALNLERAGAVC